MKNTWKKRLRENQTRMEETIESLTARRDWLRNASGDKQFSAEIIKAELLQFNQERLEIETKIHKLSVDAKEAKLAKQEPSPSEIFAQAESIEIQPGV